MPRGGSQKAPVTVFWPRPAQKPLRGSQAPFQVRKFASKNGVLKNPVGTNQYILVQDDSLCRNCISDGCFYSWGPVVLTPPKVVPKRDHVHTDFGTFLRDRHRSSRVHARVRAKIILLTREQ